MFLVAIFNFIAPSLVEKESVDFSEWEKEVDDFYLSLSVKSNDSLLLSPFYPNRISFDKLVKIGIPKKVARNWVNYVSAGGKFSSSEDVKKIYGITPKIYSQIEKYMLFQIDNEERVREASPAKNSGLPEKAKNEKTKKTYLSKKTAIVEINSADSARLEALPGFGGVLSGRIIKYRAMLGGFYSVDQLNEVYGLKDEYLSKAVPYLTVEAGDISKLRINFLSESELAKHPYISYKYARAIVGFRSEKGKINGVEDISAVLGGEELKKIEPYLSFK
jgi:DNA uptake protein ComE-like DNA-binding protein